MFGGFSLLKIGIVLAAATAIAIPVWLHVREDNRKDNMITVLQDNIVQLEVDKKLLSTSNTSLEQEIDKRLREIKDITAENERFREADREALTVVADLRKKLNSDERRKRIEKIRNSRGASLLLRKANRQADCGWSNFDRLDGRCIEGVFVLNGERLVPLETTTDTLKSEKNSE